MANNIAVTAGTGTTVKTTDNSGVHTPHHNVDTLTTVTGTVAVQGVVSGIPLQVASRMVDQSATFTCPGGATAYSPGDVIIDNVPSQIFLANAARIVGGTGTIVYADVLFGSTLGSTPNLELWVFQEAPAADADNAAFTPLDAELYYRQGVIELSRNFIGDATSGAGGNQLICHKTDSLSLPFTCYVSYTKIGLVLVTRSAVTIPTNTAVEIRLRIVQD